MAIRTITTTINGNTGQLINTINGLLSTETITGVSIRQNICLGPDLLSLPELDAPLTPVWNPPNGSLTTLTVPNTADYGGVGVIPLPLTVKLKLEGGDLGAPTVYYVGTDFTIIGRVITLLGGATPWDGTGKSAEISYDYYNPIVADLSYNTRVEPNNCRGFATLSGSPWILWDNGLFIQDLKPGVTSGTVNGVIEAIITDA